MSATAERFPLPTIQSLTADILYQSLTADIPGLSDYDAAHGKYVVSDTVDLAGKATKAEAQLLAKSLLAEIRGRIASDRDKEP